METDRALKLMKSPEFVALAGRRRRVAWSLTAVNIVVYLVYVLAMGFARETMAQPLVEGAINVGIAFTVALVILAPVLSFSYIWWANRFYDPAIQALKSSAMTGSQQP